MAFLARLMRKITEEPVYTRSVVTIGQEAVDVFTRYTSNNGRVVADWNVEDFVSFMNDLAAVFKGDE